MGPIDYNIVAKPFLCVGAVVELAILKKLSLKISQEQIAEFFGVNVPVTYSGEIKNVNYVEDEYLYGMIFGKEGLNPFFERFNLPLKEKYFPINQFQMWDFENSIKEHKLLNHEIVVGFSYGVLYNKPEYLKTGHACLIEKIGPREIEIYDPGPAQAGYKKVLIDDLFDAIKSKNDGVWIIN